MEARSNSLCVPLPGQQPERHEPGTETQPPLHLLVHGLEPPYFTDRKQEEIRKRETLILQIGDQKGWWEAGDQAHMY